MKTVCCAGGGMDSLCSFVCLFEKRVRFIGQQWMYIISITSEIVLCLLDDICNEKLRLTKQEEDNVR